MSEKKRPVALVTGATAGIGAAFARRLADEGHDLVLSARNGERLREMAEELPAETEVLVADLATEEGVQALEERCREGVDLLVNNAGFGHSEPFLTVSAEREAVMARLHMEAVLRGTLAALPGMVERGRGGVVNVASVAAFFPGSTYAASKAWVVSFSQATAAEVAARGVSVTALCPGFTRTEFHQRAEMNMSKLPKSMWLNAEDVVAKGLSDMRRGKAVSVPGWRYKTLMAVGRRLPLSLSGRALASISRRRLRKK
ncbi:SDR family NAD(P)-dependent oxidoreductase [Salininema proteolyticum]|uniref:SDR family NAD(P)-dependent oxidoreductase n=1 Tax=Salininema proteolyticum TaxID=1607685 RepID=A0ABV8U0J3_9ACTN